MKSLYIYIPWFWIKTQEVKPLFGPHSPPLSNVVSPRRGCRIAPTTTVPNPQTLSHNHNHLSLSLSSWKKYGTTSISPPSTTTPTATAIAAPPQTTPPPWGATTSSTSSPPKTHHHHHLNNNNNHHPSTAATDLRRPLRPPWLWGWIRAQMITTSSAPSWRAHCWGPFRVRPVWTFRLRVWLRVCRVWRGNGARSPIRIPANGGTSAWSRTASPPLDRGLENRHACFSSNNPYMF